MKIAVCIKQVPTREWQPRLAEDKKWIQEQDVSYEMNEPDAYALEEALRLREKHGGEVVVCSAGPSRVAKVLREALARGADRGLHIEADRLGSADAFVVADALSVSYGKGYEKRRYNDARRGLSAAEPFHQQTGGGTGPNEYENVRYTGFSAAINMGPVALKATRNYVDGAGENGSSQPRKHSEINLSIAF